MREKILDIAIRQMKSGGYENLNFANIAAEVGASRANIHHHFKNKEGLGIAATESYIQGAKSTMDSLLQKHEGDIKTILKMLEEHLIEIVTQSGSTNSCIISQLVHDSEAPETLRKLAIDQSREEEALIEAQIIKAKSNGTLDKAVNEKNLAFRVMATMFGITQMALIEQNRGNLVKKIRGALVSLLE